MRIIYPCYENSTSKYIEVILCPHILLYYHKKLCLSINNVFIWYLIIIYLNKLGLLVNFDGALLPSTTCILFSTCFNAYTVTKLLSIKVNKNNLFLVLAFNYTLHPLSATETTLSPSKAEVSTEYAPLSSLYKFYLIYSLGYL